MRLIQIQISLVYTYAAVLKMGGNLWLNGSALHYVLNNSEVYRFEPQLPDAVPDPDQPDDVLGPGDGVRPGLFALVPVGPALS